MTDHDQSADPNAPETRTLRDAQGMDRVVTMLRIYWGSYAFLLRETTRTMENLLAIADEEAPRHNMTWHDYFPEGLACMQHFYLHQRPDLMKSNYLTIEHLSDHIGPVSKIQIEALKPPEPPEADADTSD